MCFLLIIMVGNSQSLDQLVQLAIDNNLELKAMKQNYLAASTKVNQVGYLKDPEVSVGMYAFPPETRLGAQRLKLGISQMFPWKGLLSNQRKLSSIEAKIELLALNNQSIQIVFDLQKTYFLLYELEKKQKIIHKQLNLVLSLEKISLSMVESGKSNIADVLRIRLRNQALNQELLMIDNEIRKLEIKINTIISRSVNENIIVDDHLDLAIILIEKDSLNFLFFEDHPGIEMYNLQVEIGEQKRRLNELDGKPKFGVGLDYTMVERRSDVQPEDNGRDILLARLKVAIPISRKRYQARDLEEQLKIERNEFEKAYKRSHFISIIQQSIMDYENNKLEVELFSNQIVTLKRSIKIIQSIYESTGKQFDTLLELEHELLNYELKKIHSIVESHISKVSIERYFQ